MTLDSVELRDTIQNLLSTSVIFVDHLPILNTFFKKKKISFYYFNYVHWWGLHMHMKGPLRSEVSDSPAAEVTGNSKLSDVGVGSQTQVLRKSNSLCS